MPDALASPELATPALVVDLARTKENISQMASRAQSFGVELWPHVKTHKCKEIAKLQLAAGAMGLTAATVTEAEALADAGATRLLVAYPPVGEWRINRLLTLAKRVSLSTVVDNAETALALDSACLAADVDVGLLWEIDSGTHRLGTVPGTETADQVVALAARLQRICFRGLMTFSGHSYAATTLDDVRQAAHDELDSVRLTARELRTRSLDCPVLSIGSSPTAQLMDESARGMQFRPGVYVFNDRKQVALGVTEWSSCALSVLATVLSRPCPDRVILDSGSKALSSDLMTTADAGYGVPLSGPQLLIERLYEEHAICSIAPEAQIEIGTRVRIVPNHACATVNLHRKMLVLDKDGRLSEWATGGFGWG